MQKPTATPWFPPQASVSRAESARPAPGAASGGGPGCRNRPRARPPRLPPPGPSAPATGSSGPAAARRRRQRGGCSAPRPRLPRDPGGPAPRRARRARACPRAFGTWSPGCRALPRTRWPLPSLRARRPPCGRSSLSSAGRLCSLRCARTWRCGAGRRADRAGELEQALWPRGARRRGTGLRGRGAVGSQSQESTHPWGSPRGLPGGSGLVQLRPERRRESWGDASAQRRESSEEKGVKEKCEGGAGEHGRGAGSPSKEGN